MHISFQDAYAEACQALGEEIVKSRLLARAAPPETRESSAQEEGVHPEGGAVEPTGDARA